MLDEELISVRVDIRDHSFLNLFILFIYFWLCWVFVAVRGLSLVVASGGYSSLQSRALGARTSVVVTHGMWDLPRPGIKPMSPALAGGF